MKKFKLFSENLSIDLGTSKTIITNKNGEILLHESSIVALDMKTFEILAIGEQAKNMTGKTPKNIKVFNPIKNSVITDFELTLAMLSYFLNKAIGGFSLFQPKVYCTIPSSLTDVERRSVEDLCLHAGSREAILVEETIASSVGLGFSPKEPKAYLILNIGAGTIEMSLVSLGGVINSRSIKLGGDDIDRNIYNILKRDYNLLIGVPMAEKIKNNLLTFQEEKQQEQMEVFGRTLEDQRPASIMITAGEIFLSASELANETIQGIKYLLETIPAEIAEDILETGIYFVGGLSQIDGFPAYIAEETGLVCQTTSEPIEITGVGLGKYQEI